MSDKPRNLTLERANRLTVAIADMMEAHNAQARVTVEMPALASEQVLLGSRVESAFKRSLRTNIRLDEIEDAKEALYAE